MKKEKVNWALIILMFILGWILSPYIIELLHIVGFR
jgi:hypothetical protein